MGFFGASSVSPAASLPIRGCQPNGTKSLNFFLNDNDESVNVAVLFCFVHDEQNVHSKVAL